MNTNNLIWIDKKGQIVFSVKSDLDQSIMIRIANGLTPTLTFTGTTTHCRVSITEIGKSIEATFELWQGNTLVDSWVGSETYLVIAGNHSVISGQTYTLKVTGTMDGIPFTGTPVTKKC